MRRLSDCRTIRCQPVMMRRQVGNERTRLRRPCSNRAKFKVAPGVDLRNADYAALAARFVGMPPQADWMLMSSVRDSEKWFLDFEGSRDESFAISTSAKEMSGWYNDTDFYTNVTYSDDTSAAKIRQSARRRVTTSRSGSGSPSSGTSGAIRT
jgi:hypothetical protein